jgi:hypothetical protein
MLLPTSGSKIVGQPAAAHYRLRLCSDILSRIVSTTENPNLPEPPSLPTSDFACTI